MPFSVTFRSEAETDLSEAFLYYESCRDGLGADFLLCVEAALFRIARNPNQYKNIHKNVHRALIARFPYGIYYITAGERIIVMAVLHARRNPDHWLTRT